MSIADRLGLNTQTSRILTGILGGVSLLIIGGLALQILNQLGHAIQYPQYSVSYTGGLVAILIQRPELWYQPLDVGAKMPTIYPPLYLFITHLVHAATGLPAPFVNRWYGFINILTSTILIAAITHHYTNRRDAALIAAAIFIGSPSIHQVNVWGRVDTMALALGLAAIYAIQRDHDNLAILLVIASLFTKHSMIAFPIAITVYLWRRDGLRDVAEWAASVIGGGLVLLGVFLYATDGVAWTHLVELNAAQDWSQGRWAGIAISFTWRHLVLLAIVVGVPTIWRESPLLPRVLAGVGLVQFFVSAGKMGSWTGYGWPALAGVAILIGWWIMDVLPAAWYHDVGVGPRRIVVAILVAQAGIYGVGMFVPGFGGDNQAAVAAEIESGPILTEDASLLTAHGWAEPYDPLVTKFAGVDVAERIREQRYTAIVSTSARESRGTRWSAEEAAAMREHYDIAARYGRFRVYRPK